ncbi:hypothetical protein BTO30_13925 [Domibacillus antri]|uniref:RNA-binding protein KhpB N-terminal domain-containing protein n=1 Tax=Domibacillus antri TaxID=1714264 RepID=A0A1Q8Q2J8_9BACI|nr:FapA family protein [Domibacillus antri]OLN21579.1 hypothetical protein BTO30_13925 [Domibacillus antri]
METSIVAKGATTEEAVQNALKLLNATLPEVDIIILENGGRSFLGMRQKAAVVKVIKKEAAEIKSKETAVGALMDEGTTNHIYEAEAASLSFRKKDTKPYIQVLNEKVIVSSPGDEQLFIVPHPHVAVYVNSRLLTGRRTVTESDEIEVRPRETVEQAKWSLNVAQDELSVSIDVQPERRITYKVKESPRLETLKLQVEKVIDVHNPLTEKEIRDELKEMGITTGIQHAEIVKAAETLEPGTFVIAKGIPPVDGVDGSIDFVVEVNRAFDTGPKVTENGKVDYRETGFIPSVEEGVLIAHIKPAQQGKPGISVTGYELKPKPAKDVIVRTGKGVRMLGGEEIISLTSGRPHVERSGNLVKIHLLKQYEHEGDVSLKSGNIYFDGDVQIKGNVKDLMKVEAKGDITITGSISKASIQSGSCIEMKGNVFSSTLSTGKSSIVISELTAQLSGIIVHLELVSKSLNFLLNDEKVRQLSIGQTWGAFRLIVGKKNALMMDELKSFIHKTARYHSLIDEEWSNLSTHLYKLFFTLPPGDRNVIEYMEETMSEAIAVYEMNKMMEDIEAKMILPYALNSRLFSSGDVIITGQGIYNCYVKAGNDFLTEGYVKGGEVYAANRIKVGKTSSETAVKTVLKTNESGIIEIGEAFEDTIIQVGKRRLHFVRKEVGVKARLSEDGFIKIR